jgi:hypothetical protein
MARCTRYGAWGPSSRLSTSRVTRGRDKEPGRPTITISRSLLICGEYWVRGHSRRGYAYCEMHMQMPRR